VLVELVNERASAAAAAAAAAATAEFLFTVIL